MKQVHFLNKHDVSKDRMNQITMNVFDVLAELSFKNKDIDTVSPGELFNAIVDNCHIVKNNERAMIYDIIIMSDGFCKN